VSSIRNQVFLGTILQQAGLVSTDRLKQALEQQKDGKKNNIGKILVERGEINQKTVDFFAEQWFKLVGEKPKQPIGQYLKQAGLLNDEQIQIILAEQKQTELKFGELAIAKGWLKQATVDFFEHYLFRKSEIEQKTEADRVINSVDLSDSEQTANSTSRLTGECSSPKHLYNTPLDKEYSDRSVLTSSQSSQQLEDSEKVHEGFLKIKCKLLKLEDRDSYSEAALKQALLWTGGQSILTQKLFKLFSENTTNITPEREIEQIDYLVQTKFLNDWENNELGKHLRTIKDRLLNNWQCQSDLLLKVYQKILNEIVPIDSSKEQQELLNMGLVVKHQERLIVANRIYQSIFSQNWVSKQLARGSEDNLEIATARSKQVDRVVSNSSKPNLHSYSHSNFKERAEHEAYSQYIKESEAKPYGEAPSSFTAPIRDRTNIASQSLSAQSPEELARMRVESEQTTQKSEEVESLKVASRPESKDTNVLKDTAMRSESRTPHMSATSPIEQPPYAPLQKRRPVSSSEKAHRHRQVRQGIDFTGFSDRGSHSLNQMQQGADKKGYSLEPRQLRPPKLPNSPRLWVAGEKSLHNITSQQQFDRTTQTANNNYFQLKNVLLLLGFIGLLSLLFNNFAQQIGVRVAFRKGNQLLKQKLYEQAIAEYDRLLGQNNNYYEAWTYRGYALAGLQKYQEMQESCSTATTIESKAVYAWNCQGEALYNLGRNPEAIAAFDRAIAIDKTEPIFLINKGRSLKALGKNAESIVAVEEAIEILEQIEAVRGDRSISNEFAVAFTFLGNNYVEKQQEQAAIDNYNRALTYVPNYFPAQIGKGIALNMAKRYDRAQNEFDRILNNAALTPTQQAQTLFYLGQTLCSSQQNLLGIATLEKAIDLAPNYEIAEQSLEKCT
jgi:tetratricopeptide (TPR) repeat protein